MTPEWRAAEKGDRLMGALMWFPAGSQSLFIYGSASKTGLYETFQAEFTVGELIKWACTTLGVCVESSSVQFHFPNNTLFSVLFSFCSDPEWTWSSCGLDVSPWRTHYLTTFHPWMPAVPNMEEQASLPNVSIPCHNEQRDKKKRYTVSSNPTVICWRLRLMTMMTYLVRQL